ncbi:GspE/PulE family protein [Roseimaritima ulvae]|uniref:Type II secretion system protein E n=1 Tax=Roseimaritima ulvae TaxID=980254 RepID=A0A5B9QZX2_9BACT|nr:GspE/PulE family protein [Roseimaritima ulvae]QEG43480.1 Type II secretion system protein E [Roseimaritima ulvae]
MSLLSPSSPATALPSATTRQRPAKLSAAVPGRQSSVPLGERLIEAGVLTSDELSAALSQHSRKNAKLGETLLELGFVDEATLLRVLGQQCGVPAVRLRDGLVDPAVVRLLPRNKAQQLCALVMFRVHDTLTVAMADPRNLRHTDEIERLTGLRVAPALALRTAIETSIPRCYEDDFSVDAISADMSPDAVEVQSDAVDIDLGDIESLADGSPIINLVNFIIVNALRQKASDIHVEPGHRCTTVRLRVDGQLREVLRPRRDFHAALISRLKVMAKLDIAEHRTPQDGRIHVLVEGREIDLRVSTLPTILGEKVVMRVLDRKNVTFNLDELGVPAPLLQSTKKMLSRPHGLILVTGPTGSGKTTTLYSALELIKSVHRNIVTVEDPVEYQLEQINQVPVGASKAMSFPAALRSILRQDPDVIMIGEIRDAETAAVAIQAALTGHLVLSTLHTNDSLSAVTRLADMGVEPFKIAAALAGVVAQRLVRTICPHCKTTHYPDAELLAMIGYTGDTRRPFTRGEGCRVCYDTGFQGRIGIYEVLSVDRELRQMIGHRAELDTLRECHLRAGGTLLMDEGIRMAESGRTSLEEVIRVAHFD